MENLEDLNTESIIPQENNNSGGDDKILREQDKRKLDVIVQKMVKNGESKDKIKFVVNDFKSIYGVSKPKEVKTGETVASVSSSVNGNSPSLSPKRPNTLMQRAQEDMMSKPVVGKEKRLLTKDDNVDKNIQKIVDEERKLKKNYGVDVKDRAVPMDRSNINELRKKDYVAKTAEDHIISNNIELPDFKNKKGFTEQDAQKVSNNYSELDKLGVDQGDFVGYLKNQTDFFNNEGRDVFQDETQKEFKLNKYIQGYFNDRNNFLNSKLAIESKRNPEKVSEIKSELKSLGSQYDEYKKTFLPNFYKAEQTKKAKDKELYLNVKNGKNLLDDLDKTTGNFFKGATYALSDLVIAGADALGADDYADRLRNEKEVIDWNLDRGLVTNVTGKSVKYKGNEYLVTANGNVVDKQTKTSINSFTDKNELRGIYEDAEKSKVNETLFSGRGYTQALSNTLGNLAFQVASTKGIGGATAKAGITTTTIPEMIAVGGMVSSSTYNETLQQLRASGIPDEVAKGEASKIAAMTATASMIVTKFLPNSNANKVLGELNTSEVIKQSINAFKSGGSKGVSDFLKTGAKNIIFKSSEIIKEGAGETLQELAEGKAQKIGNSWTNANLDHNILNTSFTKQELIDTAILSFAAGGIAAGAGKSKQGFFGTNLQESFDKLSGIESGKLDTIGQTMVDNGDITQDQFTDLKTKVLNYKAYKNKLADNVKGEKAVEVTQLMADRDKLKQDKKNLDEAFHPEIDAKIEAVNTKINETLNTTEADEETAQTGEEVEGNEEVVNLHNQINEIKSTDPETYWSVDTISKDAKGTVIKTDDGVAFVGEDGDIKGVTKLPESTKKGVADELLKKAVEQGGTKLDNFDTYLTKIYERNGFREVSRTPFNEEYAPEGWNKEKHGTPDVIAMVYDPEGKMDIVPQKFDDYGDMIDYRDKTLKEYESKQSNTTNTTEETAGDQEGESSSNESISSDDISKEGNQKVTDYIDSPVKYKTPNGETVEGVLKQDGQRMVVESENNIYDLGNVNEVTDLESHNLSVADKVEINDKGNITLRGKEYVNNYSNPKSAITRDANGNVQSVQLDTVDGQKRTFRGQIAEDIAYQIHSSDFSRQIEEEVNLEEKDVFDRFIDNIDGLINLIDRHTKGTLGMNILPAAAKGALKAVKLAAQTTKSTVKAIEAGIDFLKKSEWYKSLNKEEKAEFDSKSKSEIFNSMLEASVKPDEDIAQKRVDTVTIEPTKKTKGIVRENTGQTDTSQKVTTTESKLLKEKFKNLQRGFKQGTADTQLLKKEFVDYVNDNIKALSNYLTKKEIERVLNMVGKITPNNIDKVTNVIDNIVERLEGRADKAKIKSISNLQKKANKKYKTTYGSVYSKIKTITKIDPLFIPKNVLDSYHTLVQKLAKGESIDVSEVNKMAETLKDEINDYVDFKNQTKGVSSKPEDKNKRDNTRNELTVSKASVKRLFSQNRLSKLSDAGRDIVKNFLNIPDTYLDTLSTSEIARITKALDYLGSSGQLSNSVLSDVVTKYNAREASAEIKASVGNRILKAVGTYTQKIASIIGKTEYSARDFERSIANTMLQHVDTVIGGVKGTMFYDKIIHPVTSGLTKSNEQTAGVDREVSSLFNKAAGKGGEFKLNTLLQMYFRQKEFELNPSFHGDKVFSLEEHIKETLDNENNSNYDKASLNVIEETYNSVKGKTSEEILEGMSANEKVLVNRMEEIVKTMGQKSKDYNDHIVGETPLYLDYFFPRRNDNYMKNDSKDLITYHSNGAPTITGNSSNNRTARKATPLNFNTYGSFINYVKEVNLESTLGQSVKQVRTTINDLKSSDNTSLVKLANALESSVNNVLKYQLTGGSHSYDGNIDKVFKALQKNTYARVLVDFMKRLPVDVTANYLPVYTTYADRLPDMVRANKNIDKKVLNKMFETLASTQMDRLVNEGGVHSADYRSADSSNMSQTKYNKAAPDVISSFVDLMNHNVMSDYAQEMNRIYYRIADKPAVHLWKMFLNDNFKTATGKDFNGEQYLSDSKYREDNKSVLEEAIKNADKLTSNLFNTSSTSERKLKVQAGSKDFLVRINNFLRSFTNNEFKVFWDSLKGTTGIGDTSFDKRSEAARAFAIVNVRGIMYSYLGSILGDMLVNFASDDEEETKLIQKKALQKSIAQHGMLIGFGNSSAFTNLMAAFSIEMLNRNIVESDGGKYSPFEDSYLFVPNEHSKPQDMLNYLGAEGNTTRVLYDSGELAYKAMKRYQETGVLTAQDAIDLKSAQISASFVAQATGLPTEYLGKLSQKALSRKFPKQKTSSSRSSGSSNSGLSGGLSSGLSGGLSGGLSN